MTTSLLILPYLQKWDGHSLQVKVMLAPRGDPLKSLDTNKPASPSFANADFKLDVFITPGLDNMPLQGGTAYSTITTPPAPKAADIFAALASQFDIDPNPQPPTRPPAGTLVMKYLPLSYQQAVSFSPGRTDLVVTGNEYACAMKAPRPSPPREIPVVSKIPWGKVFALILRNPAMAAAAGIIRTISISISDSSLLEAGGYLYCNLSSSSDGASLLPVPNAIKFYATRIPGLTGTRDIFSPVLVPVPKTPSGQSFDEIFEEIDNYDDGWAKAVHCGQLKQLNPLTEDGDGTRPVSELGIRIGWDDEQVTLWMNRQLDPSQASLDCPLGVAGYRIDVQSNGKPDWYSLVYGSGDLGIGNLDLGSFNGELSVETHPVQLHAETSGTFWLPTYFTSWRGPSLASLDAVQYYLDGGKDKRNDPGVKGVAPGIQLTYGKSYNFRVRLMDSTGGGPATSGAPIVPGPNPIGSCDFRRWIRPVEPIISNAPDADPDPENPLSSITVQRPLLQYPAVACTGYYTNAVNDLIADLPAAKVASRRPALPDPDVDRVQITIEVQGLVNDTANTDGGYMPVATTTRKFPSDPYQPLVLGFNWIDLTNVSTLSQQEPGNGPLLLPTARMIRLRIRSLCKDDPNLAYFGAADVQQGMDTTFSLTKYSSDETNLLVPQLPSDQLRAIFMQPELPINQAVLQAQQLAGKSNQRLTDNASQLSSTLGLLNDGLTLRVKQGRRVLFGASAALHATIGPDLASIRFASSTDLIHHWIMVIKMTLNRDWTWNELADKGIVVKRDGNEVGTMSLNGSISTDALTHPDRTQTDLFFFDAIDPKPANGEFPRETNTMYSVQFQMEGTPKTDALWTFSTRLPVTTPPAQVPKIVSAGIAMSSYVRDAGTYASSQTRHKALWIELDSPPADDKDAYFARVLTNAPDPLLLARTLEPQTETPEPPLPIDLESLRLITPNESNDGAGLDAMQPLIPSDQDGLHWMLPLPPGMTETSAELFGFFKYELRVGHTRDIWSTAQGRFGAPLQVNGVQHPAPPLTCDVVRNTGGILVSAPFAFPVSNGKPAQPIASLSQIWVMIYAQAAQLDGLDCRNVLLTHQIATARINEIRTGPLNGTATFEPATVAAAAKAMGFSPDAPLSVLAVETLPQGKVPADPLGADLGGQRILRTSNLVPVPHICGS